MNGELDAAGNLANAGLIAGVIEGSGRGEAGEGLCLNCEAPLQGGRYCRNCGQAAHANRSLWALVEELAWNVFNLDTKAWRTVPRLIGRPGTLTRSYIDGKRARYLTPLATFLLCYFFMFLVFSAVPKPETLNLSDNNSAVEHVTDARDNLKDAQDTLQEAQQGLAEARRDAGPHPNAAQQLAIGAAERVVSTAQERLQRRQVALERAQQRQQEAAHTPVHVHVNDQDRAAIQQSITTQAPPAPVAPQSSDATTRDAPHPPAVTGPALNTDDGPITLDDVLRKIARENITVDGRPWLSPAARAQLSNPPLFYSHLQDSASRWGFLLVPFSLPFIAFLFLFKKNITLYDHTVFALNSLSFASLLFALMLGASEVSWLHWVPGIALGLVLPVHTFFHIGGAYKMKWWSALWRTFFMLFFATFVLIMFFIAVLFIGLAGIIAMSQTDLFVTIGSAAVILLMLSVAWVLGFRQSARLDDAELARLARGEGANVEAAVIDVKGRAAVAKLNGGKLLIAKVMADGVSTRVLPQRQAQVRLAQHKLTITFGDLGYPSLNMRLEKPPAWLAELGARP